MAMRAIFFPALTSLSLPEIVSGLHRKPGFDRSAQWLLKSDRHVRADGEYYKIGLPKNGKAVIGD
jgi:hypothetical protein